MARELTAAAREALDEARGMVAPIPLPPKIENAPGLVWRPRVRNRWVAYWQARTELASRGYYPRSARIWTGSEPSPEDRELIARSCRVNQANMLEWSANPNAENRKRLYAGHVYFITNGEAVKIGFSQDVLRRMGNMQTENHRQLTLLSSIPATIEDELAIQQRFRHLHIRGDWFRIEGDLSEFIAGLPAGYTLCRPGWQRRQRRAES